MILRFLGRLSLLALVALPAVEARADIFTVREVQVDATGDSVAAAREQAMAEGQVRAVERLWERLVPPDQRALIPPLSPGELSDYYIQRFSVSGERTSTNRYIADLTVQFRPDQVRQFLRNNGVAYAETRSRPTLILPLYGAPGSATLWAGENPWLAAWQQHNSEDDLVPIVAPLGDLSDLTTVDADRASAGDVEAFATIAEQYGAGDVLVSRAAVTGDPDAGTASVEVQTQRYPSDAYAPAGSASGPADMGSERLSQEAGEELEGLLARAAAAVSARVQADWLSQNQLRYDQEAQLQASVPVNTLNELVEVQRRLSRVAAVRDHYTLRVTRRSADIGLVYYGDPMQLQRALSQVDLALEQRPAVAPGRPAWQLRLTRAALEIDSAPLGGDTGLGMERLPEPDANGQPLAGPGEALPGETESPAPAAPDAGAPDAGAPDAQTPGASAPQ